MKTSQGEHRRHQRSRIKTTVSMNLEPEPVITHTSGIFSSGVALPNNGQRQLKPGQKVRLTFEDDEHLIVEATIVRVSAQDIEVALAPPLSDNQVGNIIQTAPWHQRLRLRIRRSFWRNTRRISLFLCNTLLRPLFIRLVRPSFLFAVYGTERDVATYTTPAMVRLMPDLLLGGVIRNGSRRGLLVASKFYEQELAQDSTKVRAYLQHLRAEFPRIKTIALVGRLPNFVMKAGEPIAPPFVDGSMGTRYMIYDIARQLLLRPEQQGENTITVLGGAGRIGNRVCEDLTRIYRTVIAFDPRYTEPEQIYTPLGKIVRSNDPKVFEQCRLYIALTHHGDVIRPLAQHMPPGSVVADDTHPCISLEVRQEMGQREISVEKIVLVHADFHMWPRMPGWNNSAIPGCLVEALVLLEQQDADVADFEAFCKTARDIGFAGKLIPPLDE
ncbi:MAG: PilZ domain-containing protein [Pseudomonadota bacterium]|nr:hypothetical protein [Pseudomonadales bacterium]MDY6919443.1 PilZ domain-containing protein [Pseudomonadota bacterium]